MDDMAVQSKIEGVLHEVLEALEDLSSEKRKEQIRYFAPGSQEVAGVSNPDMKEVIKALKEKYRDWKEKDWILLSKELVKRDIFECQIIAYELIGRNKNIMNTLRCVYLELEWNDFKNKKLMNFHLF